MTDYRNYIYRLAEMAGGELIWDKRDDLNRDRIVAMVTDYMVNNELQDFQSGSMSLDEAKAKGLLYDA